MTESSPERVRRRQRGVTRPKGPEEAAEATVKQVPVPVTRHRVYIFYYYETTDGVSSFSNIVLSGRPDIRTQQDIEEAIVMIKSTMPDTDFEKLEIVNWKPLEG